MNSELKSKLQSAVKECHDAKGAIDWSKFLSLLGPIIQLLVDTLSKKEAVRKGLKAAGCDDEACVIGEKSRASLEISAQALMVQCETCEELCCYLGLGEDGGGEGEGEETGEETAGASKKSKKK